MKSVADLIANKNALIKRDKRGKITAASLTAAGAAVLAAAQAEAQSVDGFEDITSSVISFERIGNGQIEFELENGQRFIANEGQYIIEGNQILVSQELVTIVGGAGINPTVIAVGVAGAALVVGALILMNSDDDNDATTTTTTTTTTTPGTTTNITSDSSGEATGTAGNDTFTVTDTSALDAITAINGGDGTDKVTLTEVLDDTTSPTFDLGSRGVTLTSIEQFGVSVDASSGTVNIDMSGETAALTVTNTQDGTNDISITDLGPNASGSSTGEITVVNGEGAQTVNVDTDTGIDKLVVNLQNAGNSASDPLVVDVSGSSEPITEMTVSSDGSSTNSINLKADSSLTQLNLDGTENLNVENTVGHNDGTSDLSAVTSLDASGASGNIVVSVDDTVTTLNMGSGNDTVNAAAAPAAAATWDGGLGNDTLDLAGLGSNTATISSFETIIASGGTVDFTNITDVDDLQVSSTVTVDDISDGAIADQITFATGSNVTLANGSTETELKFVGGGTLAVVNNAAALTDLIIDQTNDVSLTLTGTNTDKLEIRGSENATLAGAGVAALTTVFASSASQVTATANPFDAIATYTGSMSGKDTINIDGLAPSATINTKGGDDVVTFTSNATTGNSATVDLDAGDDAVTLPDEMDSGTITLDGGAGDDTFNLGSSANVDVTIKINAGDFSVSATAVTDGTIDAADAETITGFQVGAGNDLIDLSSLGLTGPIVTVDSTAGVPAALNNAFNAVDDGFDDIVFVGNGANIDYIFYDNGANGVGIIEFAVAITLSTVNGEDVLF